MKTRHFYILLIVFGVIFSCIKFKELATLTTNNTSNLTISSVTCGGNITNGGSADISAAEFVGVLLKILKFLGLIHLMGQAQEVLQVI